MSRQGKDKSFGSCLFPSFALPSAQKSADTHKKKTRLGRRTNNFGTRIASNKYVEKQETEEGRRRQSQWLLGTKAAEPGFI